MPVVGCGYEAVERAAQVPAGKRHITCEYSVQNPKCLPLPFAMLMYRLYKSPNT